MVLRLSAVLLACLLGGPVLAAKSEPTVRADPSDFPDQRAPALIEPAEIVDGLVQRGIVAPEDRSSEPLRILAEQLEIDHRSGRPGSRPR